MSEQRGFRFTRLERDVELRTRLRPILGYYPHEDGAALDELAVKHGIERRLVEDEAR